MSYEGIKALNWSSLKHLAVSPLHYKYRQEHKEKSKPAYVIGGATHTRILEPALFDSRYGVFDGTRKGKEWDAWLAANPGKESIKPPELATIDAMAKMVREHRVASTLITGGRYEQTIEWVDAATGIKCKGRVDYIKPDSLVDLKTAPAIGKRDSALAAGKFLYHAQLAWYLDGAVASGALPADAAARIIFLQKAPPYDVAVRRLNNVDLAIGRAIMRHLLNRYAECTEADYWPGIAPDEEELNAPEWSADMTMEQESEDF